MKFLLKNSENSQVIEFETDSINKAKNKASRSFYDLDKNSLLLIYKGRKLLYSRKLCDRFWTEGLRTGRNINSEKFTPIDPLKKRLENLKARKKELESDLKKTIRFIAETEKQIKKLRGKNMKSR